MSAIREVQPMIVLVALVWVLCLIAAGFLRLSQWHRRESDYWHRVHLRWLLSPAETDRLFLPVLDWARANPPSLLRRLRPWQSPALRMFDADGRVDRRMVP